MMKFENRMKIQTRLKIHQGCPDLIPFLCLFFLLLIFFMIGSSFVQVSGIPVDLPEIQVRSSFGAKKIIITVDKGGRIFLNDIEVSDPAKLKAKLLELATTSQDRTTIILRADASAEYGTVARIMSLAEDLKINVFLLTTPPASRGGGVRFFDAE